MFIKNSLKEKKVKSMNTNKKYISFLIVFILVSLFLGITKVDAKATNVVNCNSFLSQKDCSKFPSCRWQGGACYAQVVAQEPCNDGNIRHVLKIFGYFLIVAKLAIPLLLIGFGTFDIYKSVIDKDEKSLTKQIKKLGFRVLAGIVVFFIPNIVYAVFNLSDKLEVINTDEYKTCAECILDPLEDNLCILEEDK